MAHQIKIAVAYFSGYGHTAKVADHVANGAKEAGAHVSVIAVDKIDDSDWSSLDNADAIIFGAPTYMGGVAAQFKTFIDAASSRWFKQLWKDKVAAGFTNSMSLSGDKCVTLQQLIVNAMQHGMIWVGQTEVAPRMSGTDTPSVEDINRVGSYMGLMTQSNNEPAEVSPAGGDLKTAVLFGKRVAEVTAQFKVNRL